MRYLLAAILLLLAACTAVEEPQLRPSLPEEQKPLEPQPAEPAPEENACPPDEVLNFTSLHRSSYEGLEDAQTRVVEDAQSWMALWREMTRDRQPAPPTPTVNFENEMVLAAFLGQRSTGGHSIEITQVEIKDCTMLVTVERSSPPPGGMVTMAFTQPSHAVIVARTDLPVEFT